MKYMKYFNWNGCFGCLFVPLPDQPKIYDVYILIKDIEATKNIPVDMQNSIIRIFSTLDIQSIRLWISSNEKLPDRLQREEAKSFLKKLSLHWIPCHPNLPSVIPKIIQNGEKITLPFVPEFAHDINRAKLIVEGKFDEILPITAEFVPTLNCPFRCLQCSYKIPKIACGEWLTNNSTDIRWHMQEDIVPILIYRFAEAGVKYLVTTGGGEPLFNAKVTIKALQLSKEHHILTGLYTNGFSLKNYALDILKTEPVFVRISVNAGSQDVHQKYHSPLPSIKNAFKEVRDGIYEIASIRAREGYRTEIGLSYIINSTNYDDTKQFAMWVQKIIKDVRESVGISEEIPIIDFVRFTPTIDYFFHSQQSQDFFDSAIKKIQEESIPILKEAGVISTLFLQRFESVNQVKEYSECLGSSFFVESSPDGSLYLCCEMRSLPGYWIGDVLRNSIKTIWNSDERKKVIGRLKDGMLRGCPTFCKPHRINKICYLIQKMSTTNQDRTTIFQWLFDLNEIHNFHENDDFFIKSKTVAF